MLYWIEWGWCRGITVETLTDGWIIHCRGHWSGGVQSSRMCRSEGRDVRAECIFCFFCFQGDRGFDGQSGPKGDQGEKGERVS